jgi:vancomycin permeability regulator SanA
MLTQMRLATRVTLAEGARPWLWLGCCLLLLTDLFWVFGRLPMAGRGRIYSSSTLPVERVPVLILGAGVLSDREPTQVLQSRLDVGLDLYRDGKAGWLLVSGDNRAANYNEPQAMRRWLVKRGVPEDLVLCDYAGRRTYDSLKRAQAVFGVQRMVVVTSDFHLARAMYLARHLGLDVYGVPASTDFLPWPSRAGFWAREFLARHLAAWDVWFPPATLLGPRETTPDDPAGPPASGLWRTNH